MDEMYDEVLQFMEKSHRAFAARVAQPTIVSFGDGHVFRYQERDIHQALVQKLARVVSGLHAARLLLAHGFLQELGALERMIDEFNEDILFLANSVISCDTTELHREYLAEFYEEEFDDPSSAMRSTQKRRTVPRQKIIAYITRIEGAGLDPSSNIEATRTLQKLFGGFVHGASPQIMEMYCGNPPFFHLRGMSGTSFASEHREGLWNYFYRSIISFVCTAKAFGDEALCQSVLTYMRNFARANGEDYPRPPGRPE
jgi:hypothetical protein